MIRTVEALIDEQGDVHLLEPLHVEGTRRALVTILEEVPAGIPEIAIMSQSALAQDWGRPEEDEAWSHLRELL